MAAHARDVNILIWTSRKSVVHEKNDRVMVHGNVTRADGRRSRSRAKIKEILGSRDGRAGIPALYAIDAGAHGPKHERSIMAGQNYGTMLLNVEKFAEARSFLRQYASHIQGLGENHPVSQLELVGHMQTPCKATPALPWMICSRQRRHLLRC